MVGWDRSWGWSWACGWSWDCDEGDGDGDVMLVVIQVLRLRQGDDIIFLRKLRKSTNNDISTSVRLGRKFWRREKITIGTRTYVVQCVGTLKPNATKNLPVIYADWRRRYVYAYLTITRRRCVLDSCLYTRVRIRFASFSITNEIVIDEHAPRGTVTITITITQKNHHSVLYVFANWYF